MNPGAKLSGGISGSILDRDGEDEDGADLAAVTKAKEELYKHQSGDVSSDEDEGSVDNNNHDDEHESGSTDTGLDSSEDRMAQYASLGGGDDDDFEDFQEAMPGMLPTPPSSAIHDLPFMEERDEMSGGVGLSLPSEEEAPYDLNKSTSYTIPQLPPCAPAERLKPLSADKIASIKKAMSTIKITPRVNQSEGIVKVLIGKRIGDENSEEK